MSNPLDIHAEKLIATFAEEIQRNIADYTMCETKEELQDAVRECIIGQLEDYSDRLVEAVAEKIITDNERDFNLIDEEEENDDDDENDD